ncbi:MAG: helix-turn-helix transcriptional regulator [Egibacteraceae bacterium]
MPSSQRIRQAHQDEDPLAQCHYEGGQLKNFLRACLLLLLREQPGHGYDLVERLKDFGFDKDPGGVYRALRSLERDGLLHSAWETSPAGPARRGYELTWEGEQVLAAWSERLADSRAILDKYLSRYQSTHARVPQGGAANGRP